MLVLVQWTRANPTDWEPVEVTRDPDWRTLPKKAEPVGGEVIDDTPGWVYALNVQGVTFAGFDHYSVRFNSLESGVYVTVWNDDPVDYQPIDFRAAEWSFLIPGADPAINGRMNTRQRLTVWSDDPEYRARMAEVRASDGAVVVNPWAAFRAPQENMTRHGIYVPDALSDAHQAAQSPHGWREWVPVG
jgi:hypothetical protein